MSYKEEISLVITNEPRINKLGKSFVMKFNCSNIISNNSHQQVEVWSNCKLALQESSLKLTIGTSVKLFGHLRPDCFRVSLDYGGKIDTNVEDYEHNILVELIIKKIHTEYISFIQDPLLHYLAEYPFKNGNMLNSLSKIGASCGIRGKHHSVNGGLLFHMDEMLRLLKSDTSNPQINMEIAIVAIIWHDLGKTAIVNENNPSQLKISNKSPIDHERMGGILFGYAIGESGMGMDRDSIPLKILISIIANIHNKPIYHDHLALIRNIDKISAGFSENNSIMTEGFKEVVVR